MQLFIIMVPKMILFFGPQTFQMPLFIVEAWPGVGSDFQS